MYGKGTWVSVKVVLFRVLFQSKLSSDCPLASYVITDQTELRKMKCLEKTGISITRELMWWWGVRLATVQQLLELLQNLKLYRAAQVIVDCE